MANGIAGDTAVVAASGYPAEDLMAIELRVISNILQLQQGNFSLDELKQLRNDQALELSLAVPVPGN